MSSSPKPTVSCWNRALTFSIAHFFKFLATPLTQPAINSLYGDVEELTRAH